PRAARGREHHALRDRAALHAAVAPRRLRGRRAAVPAGGRGAALGRGVPARVRVPGERRAAGAAADRAATNGLNSPSWRGGRRASAPQFRQVPETCGIGLATLTLGGTVVSVPREKPAVGVVRAPPSPNPWRAR